MQKLFNCVVYLHDPILLACAVLILFIGSIVTIRLFTRARETRNEIQRLWLILSGMIGGGTIWSTHFVAMLAYKSDLILGYDLTLTIVSLVIVVCTTMLGFAIASQKTNSLLIEIGGAVLGIGISSMHYTGMAAMKIQGGIHWDTPTVVASILLGALIGIVCVSLTARNFTKHHNHWGAAAFIVAVALMHFTSMSGLTLIPANMSVEVEKLVSNAALGSGIIVLMGCLYLTTFITSMIDMKNESATSEHYKYLALHDPLTGIPNRHGCEKYLKDFILAPLPDNHGVAVVGIDLDRFKSINDVHGHAAGDHLLKSISAHVSQNLKPGEMIGRFGGDEFVALKSGVSGKSDASEFAERILKAIRQPIMWNDADISTKASLGFSMFPWDSENPIKLLEQADLAMYHAKSSGKDCVVGYNKAMDSANRERATLATALASAIENEELTVHYQLQNDAQTRKITGVEALLRWHNPARGNITPDVFIPIAEETGFINELGTWVLREACTVASKWSVPIKVAVNVAAKQLADPSFADIVKNVLDETGLEPSRLELEVTESGIIGDASQALKIIKKLKALGVLIAMDDYGTGYSTLATLHNFPFDKIKIDREFIKDIDRNEHSAAILKSTMILGNSLKIPVLAEGVETEAHLSALSNEGCQLVQGFLFGKPMPNNMFEDLLAQQIRDGLWSDHFEEAAKTNVVTLKAIA
ncbi:bifunctional diguanylate cyclase/phosphodiesterase [Ahrensia sp. 13_GOM-1096m]|uniref:putative bifunctional diguanylate cyclase/phosphodiesterase n=1 Tax=Ahrensia sp. 13_GOM-1096m TaxID=1380380 RepID=UPI0009DEC64C|nr:bifunctional diguanylate cyclase/phosphodiesterase [Ahrensia sp. 13_GOM-1096m]